MAVSRIQMSNQGPEVSRIVAGMMRLNEWDHTAQDTVDWVEACLDLGITTFDHADIYGGFGNEALFGEALKLAPNLRQHMEIVTKCNIQFPTEARPEVYAHHYNSSREHIIRSAERSLHNLNTDVLDLFLIHRHDPLMNADEVAEAFIKLKTEGKVKHVGVSNMMPYQAELLRSRLSFPLVTNQIEFHVLHLDPLHNGQLDYCQQHRIAPMSWSPLAGGRIFNPSDEREVQLHQTLQTIANELGGASLDQVALAWIMRHPAGPIPVMGTGKIDRLKSAGAALELKMDRQQWFRIWVASAGQALP